jgi:hypothetical protein
LDVDPGGAGIELRAQLDAGVKRRERAGVGELDRDAPRVGPVATGRVERGGASARQVLVAVEMRRVAGSTGQARRREQLGEVVAHRAGRR